MPLVYLGELQKVIVDGTKTTCGPQEAIQDLFGGSAHKTLRFQTGKSCVHLPADTCGEGQGALALPLSGIFFSRLPIRLHLGASSAATQCATNE